MKSKNTNGRESGDISNFEEDKIELNSMLDMVFESDGEDF